jgi:hypothetical protein
VKKEKKKKMGVGAIARDHEGKVVKFSKDF